MTNLKNNLNVLLDKNNLSVSEAERLAGLRISALRNILRGQSKNPSVEILSKLAALFQCSISELMGESIDIKNKHFQTQIDNFEFFVDFSNFVKTFCEEKHVMLSYKKFSNIQSESYDYTVENKLKTMDKNFTKWLLQKETSRIENKEIPLKPL
ncbi:MAG: helix-turn-helix transcriptional regulator [Simkaniaceae bacterium]|nr:helix-turn-helix transcriptional regulator [Simkaniaceae bacterium]